MKSRWITYLSTTIAREISSISRYYDSLIQWRAPSPDPSELFDGIDCPLKRVATTADGIPRGDGEPNQRTLVVLDGTLNSHEDCYRALIDLKGRLSRRDRVVLVYYTRWFRCVEWIKRCLSRTPPRAIQVFWNRPQLESLARSTGYEIVRTRPVAHCPVPFPGIARAVNFLAPVIPVVRWWSLARVILLRPLQGGSVRPSLSVIVPARNERGNIEPLVRRLPSIKHVALEILFVEGNSNDATWAEIQRVRAAYAGRGEIQAYQQLGRGKADAVRLGVAHATGELIAVLDADLSVPPELLDRFYEAYCSGAADFINGNRFVYPMEVGAMRMLNWLGNRAFATMLNTVLDSRMGDTLCGTKLFARHDYERFQRWRDVFGDYDPFGDFDLLFPAAALGLGVVDVAIPYAARSYGRTQIHRIRDGMRLLLMVLAGLVKVKAGK